MDRRDFLKTASVGIMPVLPPKENTLEAQKLVIKAIYLISTKLQSIMKVILPFWHVIDTEWFSTIELEVCGLIGDRLLLVNTEKLPAVSEQRKFIVDNCVDLNLLPEIIDFDSGYVPTVEIFRVVLPQHRVRYGELL